MECAVRTSKDEPDREETVIPRTMPAPARQPSRPAKNDPEPVAVPLPERKRAA